MRESTVEGAHCTELFAEAITSVLGHWEDSVVSGSAQCPGLESYLLHPSLPVRPRVTYLTFLSQCYSKCNLETVRAGLQGDEELVPECKIICATEHMDFSFQRKTFSMKEAVH